MRECAGLLVLAGLLWVAAPVQAQDGGGGGLSLTTLLALGAFSLLPFLLMTATSFVKLSVVLGVLRSAFGAAQVPSGGIVTALAAILTAYVMAPVATEVVQASAAASARVDLERPLQGDSRAAVIEVLERGKEPVREFLLRNAGEREVALFLRLAREARPPEERQDVSGRDLLVALPAFLITELAEAFQIAFFVLLPFLVVDLVVANILVALGMFMLSPTSVSLPFKLLLFVLVDGFYVLSEALVAGYA
jgi:type III secretion protein R